MSDEIQLLLDVANEYGQVNVTVDEIKQIIAEVIDECMDIVIDHNALITSLGYNRILYDMAKLKSQN